jgi:hypothetical protein
MYEKPDDQRIANLERSDKAHTVLIACCITAIICLGVAVVAIWMKLA